MNRWNRRVSLPKMSSGVALAGISASFGGNGQSSQVRWRCAGVDPEVAGQTRGRDPVSAPAGPGPEAVGARPAQAGTDRQADFRLALSAFPDRVRRRVDLQAGDAGAVASAGFSPVLALEVPATGWAPYPSSGCPQAGPAHEPRKPSVGRASHTWRASEARDMDLFVVPTIGFRLLYGLAILRLGRRQLVWTNATTNPCPYRKLCARRNPS